MNQLIDIITVTILGILLTSGTAFIIWFNAKSFPQEDAKTLKLWALGLFLQPLAWIVFSYRGSVPEPKLSIIANMLIIGGFAFLTKATREFLGVKSKDAVLIATMVLVGVAIAAFTIVWPNFSAMVVINCCGSLMALSLMLIPLKKSLRHNNSTSQKIVFSVTFLGLFALIARMLDHLYAPRIGGNFLEPSIEDSFAVIYAATGPVLASFGFLLLHQERAYKKLESMASKDSLTGILNRQSFEQKANKHFNDANNSGNPICVILIDIDYFKQINDTYGHETGDEVLKQCSTTIEHLLRDKDIIGRMGGEEFMVLLPNIDLINAKKVTNRILATISKTEFINNETSIKLTVSIGLAKKMSNEISFAQTLKRADLAMYEAKRLGRNQVFYSENNYLAIK